MLFTCRAFGTRVLEYWLLGPSRSALQAMPGPRLWQAEAKECRAWKGSWDVVPRLWSDESFAQYPRGRLPRGTVRPRHEMSGVIEALVMGGELDSHGSVCGRPVVACGPSNDSHRRPDYSRTAAGEKMSKQKTNTHTHTYTRAPEKHMSTGILQTLVYSIWESTW